MLISKDGPGAGMCMPKVPEPWNSLVYSEGMNLLLKSLLAAALLATSVFGAPITISTGSAAVWLVNGNATFVETPLPTGIWIPNFGDGSWIGPDASAGNPAIGAAPGTYTYTLSLGAYFGGAGSFSLQYAADNSVARSLTSGSLGGTTSCDAVLSSLSECFGSSTGAPRTLTGDFTLNSILTATIFNGTDPQNPQTNNPTGLLVVGTADSAVPEPSTYTMFGMGIAAIVFARSRRK